MSDQEKQENLARERQIKQQQEDANAPKGRDVLHHARKLDKNLADRGGGKTVEDRLREKLGFKPKSPGNAAPQGAPDPSKAIKTEGPPPSGGTADGGQVGTEAGEGTAKTAGSGLAKEGGKEVAEKTAQEIGVEGAKTAGKEVATGAIDAAAAGAEAAGLAAAPETGGLSLALTIAGLALTAAQWVKHFWKKHWLAIITIVGMFLFAGVGIVYALISIFHGFDTNTKEGTQILSVISQETNSGKLTLTPAALSQIQNGKVGAVVASLVSNIAENHENVAIDTSYTENGKTVNDGSSFAIKSLDNIKCTDTATKQPATTIPINLDPTYDWKANITADLQNKSVLCATDYYPMIDTPMSATYSNEFGPGEFDLKNIAVAGPEAAQQKTAQVTAEIMTSSATVADEGQKDLLPAKIEIPSGLFSKNLKTGDDSFSSTMQTLNQDLRTNKKKNVSITSSGGIGNLIIKTI